MAKLEFYSTLARAIRFSHYVDTGKGIDQWKAYSFAGYIGNRQLSGGAGYDDGVVAAWFPAYTAPDFSRMANTNIYITQTSDIYLGQASFRVGTKAHILPNTITCKPAESTQYPAPYTTAEIQSAISTIKALPVYKSFDVWGYNIPISTWTEAQQIMSSGMGFTNDGNYYSLRSIILVVEYDDRDAPATVTLKSPISRTIIGNSSNTFTWEIAQEANEAQSHYDLQVSLDGGISWTTYANKVASATNSHTFTGGTLASGDCLWRVRVYTRSGNIVSEWAQARVNVQNNAETSSVTCDGAPMPTVTWTAVDQQAYQVRIGDYDSGTIYSGSGQHRPARYFPDDAYEVTVRTQSSLGIWSEWTTPLYIDIKNVQGINITLTASAFSNGVALQWTTEGIYNTYYILRDGIPIAKTTTKTYLDKLAYGARKYTILAPRTAGKYTTSNDVVQDIALPYDVISAADNIAWIPLRYALGNLISRSYSDSDTIQYRYFAGRENPIAFRAGQRSRKASLRYAFKTPSEADAIRALIGRVIVYKDRRGNRIIGMIDNKNDVVGTMADMSLNITEIDYNEEVAYDTDYPAS
jgi:hypothetical protein